MTEFFLANVFYFMKTISHPLKLCMLNNSSSNMANSIKRKAHISPCIVCIKLIAESKDAETCLDITYVKFNGGEGSKNKPQDLLVGESK